MMTHCEGHQGEEGTRKLTPGETAEAEGLPGRAVCGQQGHSLCLPISDEFSWGERIQSYAETAKDNADTG